MIVRFLKDELVSVAVKKLNNAFSLKCLLSRKKKRSLITHCETNFCPHLIHKDLFPAPFQTLTLLSTCTSLFSKTHSACSNHESQEISQRCYRDGDSLQDRKSWQILYKPVDFIITFHHASSSQVSVLPLSTHGKGF